jgi:hypothetical protein
VTPERAALESAIGDVIRACHNVSLAMDLIERRALVAEAEVREMRERMDER